MRANLRPYCGFVVKYLLTQMLNSFAVKYHLRGVKYFADAKCFGIIIILFYRNTSNASISHAAGVFNCRKAI